MSNISYTTVELATLTDKDGAAFINICYEILLGRQPDSEGFNFYLEKLKDGAFKEELISNISNSSEANGRKVRVLNLRLKVINQRLHKIPFIGVFFRLIFLVKNSKRLVKLINISDNCTIDVSGLDTKKHCSELEQQTRSLINVIESETFFLRDTTRKYTNMEQSINRRLIQDGQLPALINAVESANNLVRETYRRLDGIQKSIKSVSAVEKYSDVLVNNLESSVSTNRLILRKINQLETKISNMTAPGSNNSAT